MAVRLLLSASARASARARILNLRPAVKCIHRASVLKQRLPHREIWSINGSCITPRVRASQLHTTALLSTTSAAVSSLERATDGKKCKIIWKDGEQSTYHAVWLRDNCHCPECWDSGFDMKIVLDTKELRGDVRLRSVKLEELPEKTMVHFCWSYGEQKKEHRGCIDLQWLKDNSYSMMKLKDLQKHCQPLPTAINFLPEVRYADIMNEEDALWKWMKTINEHGICLVTDMPTNPGEIEKIAKIAGGLQSFFTGKIYRVFSREENPDSTANTSRSLPLHMDYQYYESPPGVQLLQCLRLDDCIEGGENIWLDGFVVVEEMRRRFPQHFKTLTEVPATIGLFSSKLSRPVAIKYRRPHIVLGTNGEVSAITWTLQYTCPLQVPEEDVERYYEAYCCLGKMFDESDLKIQYRMKPGQTMTINNRRMLHGRNAFKLNGGVRHMELGYISSDTFKSEAHLMAAKYEPDYYVKNVFNQDYGPY